MNHTNKQGHLFCQDFQTERFRTTLLNTATTVALLPVWVRPGEKVLHLGTPSSFLFGSEKDWGRELTTDPSPWVVAIFVGFGGRGGGVGVEAWSSAWVSESTLGVEDGRRGGRGCGVDAGRGIWYPLAVNERVLGCMAKCPSSVSGISTGRRWKSKECFLGWGDGWQRGLPPRFWISEEALASRDWLSWPVMAATAQGAVLREGEEEEEEEEEVMEVGG